MKWEVVLEPEGKNPGFVDKAKAKLGAGGEQTGGIVIYVREQSTGRKEEIAAVGYYRQCTEQPKVSFEKALEAEVNKAHTAVNALNGLFPPDNNRNDDGSRRLV